MKIGRILSEECQKGKARKLLNAQKGKTNFKMPKGQKKTFKMPKGQENLECQKDKESLKCPKMPKGHANLTVQKGKKT